MSVVITFFDPGYKGKTYKLKGKYFEHFAQVFPDYKNQLRNEKECLAIFAGKDNVKVHVFLIEIKSIGCSDNRITFELGQSEKQNIESRYAAKQLKKICSIHGLGDARGMPPLVCILPEGEDVLAGAKRLKRMDELIEQKDHNAVCMMFAPLSEANENPCIWNDVDILYALGISCSKLAVSLLTPASDIKELEKKAKYRKYCTAFLKRGYEIENGNTRFASALAYRYYSNVHELMRSGERRDGNLEYEIKMAHEWLGRALEMNPQSIMNNYRKGKLIIEKQVPFLLFAKKSFGKGEAGIIREIKQVGEEHLAQAIMLYEDLEEEHKKSAYKREYAKALFILGKYYLSDTNLPIHEYYFMKLAGRKPEVHIEKIDKLNLESARVHLKRCFAAECEMPLDSALDIKKLAAQEKQWTNSPIKKLYQIGCMYSDTAFVFMAQGSEQKAIYYAKKAIKTLGYAKDISDSLRDRKRNTWYLSEKIAWAYMHIGKYEVAANLLKNARSGYVINTYATALLLCGSENARQAMMKLAIAVNDKYNLAMGLSRVLYAFVTEKTGRGLKIEKDELSEKNKRYLKILGV